MRSLTLRRTARIVAVLGVAGSASMLVLPGGTAAADTTKVGVLQQAWFWETAYEQANPPVAPPATPPNEPSGVPDGDLAVAYSGSSDKSSTKMTALSFDVGTVSAGSTISSFTFSLTLDSAPTATSYGAPSAAIAACLPTRSWPAQLGGDYTNQPGVDCSKKVVPEVNGSTYTFKIPALAQTWVDDQNLGVAIVTDPVAATAPFQLVFGGAKDLKADLAFTPGAGSTAGSTSMAGAVAVPASGGAPAPAAPVSSLPASGGGTTVAPAPPAAPPVVAPSTRPLARTAAVARTAPAAPTKAFWAAGLVLALILLAASLVLGDPAPLVATATTTSRLDRVLRARTVTES